MKRRYEIHWHTSPACARILERLECRGIGMADEIASEMHISLNHCRKSLRLLLEADRVAVAYWRHNRCGKPTPIYRLGPGPSKPMPVPETTAQRCRRRRESLIEQYGREIANRVLGASRSARGVRVVVDGQRVTASSAVRKLAGSVS